MGKKTHEGRHKSKEEESKRKRTSKHRRVKRKRTSKHKRKSNHKRMSKRKRASFEQAQAQEQAQEQAHELQRWLAISVKPIGVALTLRQRGSLCRSSSYDHSKLVDGARHDHSKLVDGARHCQRRVRSACRFFARHRYSKVSRSSSLRHRPRALHLGIHVQPSHATRQLGSRVNTLRAAPSGCAYSFFSI
jgi:hypothetical protein